MTTSGEQTVGGESATAITEALRELEFDAAPDGMFHVEGRVGAPAIRAIMRCEAELLLLDADAWGETPEATRSPEQRRADALELVLTRIIAQSNSSPPR